ncbi:phosphatidylserine decarboxylase family protein [Blattabacterium cuenoti]|uniref:phosphatidylserine decarboxylase family protein n=1 Tax=Blattabacterium cuenoti TaxID=1653831 RepID=UPI00163C2BB1|nr:phosphatidylserine decarboxylase family protein [Blattabacterium cuenoti]
MIHKEGYSFLLYFLILFLIIILFSIFLFSKLIILIISCCLIIFYCFFLFFFRNPKIIINNKNNKEILSPADGKIVKIKKLFENEFLHHDCICISIFMSPLNVHVNRFPISGKIIYVKYYPGKHFLAWNDKSSIYNERTTLVIEEKNTKKNFLLRQIAGFLARRIKIYAKKNSFAIKGKEFGFIKFGSRIDLYLPLKSILLIQKGDYVFGGKTIIAEVT